MKKAQQDASTARAGWLLRNNITDSVMTANPILKAVHGSTQSTPIETYVYPLFCANKTNINLSMIELLPLHFGI